MTAPLNTATSSPRSDRTEPGRVIVGVDGSSSSIEALREGHRMAELLGVPLVAASAWHEQHGIFPPVSYHPEQDAERDLRISIREAFRPALAPEIQLVLHKGDPADGLVELSRGASMLVLGSRGHSGIVGSMLGSVSGHCAAHAHCPVLVVHDRAASTLADDAVATEVRPVPVG